MDFGEAMKLFSIITKNIKNFRYSFYLRGLICSIFLLITLIVFNNESYGNELEKIKIDETSIGPVYLHYNPMLCKVILTNVPNESDIKTIRVAHTKLAKWNNDSLIIDYSEGGSIDPGFIIYHVKPSGLKRLSTLIDGLNIEIPGDGYLYIWGHTNSYFNLRRKFSLKNSRIQEVKQPFYYIGLNTETLTEISVFKTKKQKEMVAKLNKGTSITILLNSEDFYLLKTKRNILGWWLPKKMSYFKSEEIRGLYRIGD